MTQERDAPRQSRMVALLEALATTNEGFSPTRLDGVQVIRSTRPQPRRPVVYSPSIVIVAQGRKVGYLGDCVHVYDPDNYLVLSVLMPFECEVAQASPQAPFLALSVAVDTAVLGELVVELGQADRSAPQALAVSGAASSRLPPALGEAALRLLECLREPEDSRILGRQIVREILYRVLRGEQGAALRAAAGVTGPFGRIAQALRRIHTDYDQPLDVETLARAANMSVSVFHQHFKTVTATSPIQYLKSIRLHKARLLMAREGHNAKSAAGQVGYSSPSQFSREFKRFFGVSPVEEAARVRDNGFPK